MSLLILAGFTVSWKKKMDSAWVTGAVSSSLYVSLPSLAWPKQISWHSRSQKEEAKRHEYESPISGDCLLAKAIPFVEPIVKGWDRSFYPDGKQL